MNRLEAPAARPGLLPPTEDIMTEEHLIRQAVNRHMPTAAVASGFISPVAGLYDAEIARLDARFPYDDRTQDLGLSRLRQWLNTYAEWPAPGLLKALQREWLRQGRVHESHRPKGTPDDR